jgi:1-aminocyclopropane-1-carboxylate deaminase/D-cysteine desulfhydrase-like pyridoxal-dependent ACC family enzyme
MDLLQEMNFNEVVVQRLNDEYLRDQCIEVSVLRLDRIHPVVSGNKWFKLKYYLQQAIEKNYSCIGTFGGAFSNHILAAAYACNKQNLRCMGFIRGEAATSLSQTLLHAQSLNMQFAFISRADYKNKQVISNANPAMFFIPEGGYGETGAKGASEILQLVPDLSAYDYIVCAVVPEPCWQVLPMRR